MKYTIAYTSEPANNANNANNLHIKRMSQQYCHDLTLDDDDECDVSEDGMKCQVEQKPSSVLMNVCRKEFPSNGNNKALSHNWQRDDDNDDTDDGSVQVITLTTSTKVASAAAASVSAKPLSQLQPTKGAPTKRTFLQTSTDDESDSELMLRAGPTFSTRTTATSMTATSTTAVAKSFATFQQYNYDDDDDESDSDAKPFARKKPADTSTAVAATEICNNKTQSKEEKKRQREILAEHRKRIREEEKRQESLRRQEQKVQQEEEKRREKLQREEQRKQQKIQREQLKIAEKDAKRRHVNHIKQQQGKYAPQEICILVDPLMTTQCGQIISNLRETYMVEEFQAFGNSGGGAHAVQWIRRDYSAGGAAAAWQSLQQQSSDCQQQQQHGDDDDRYEHSDRLLLVFYEPKHFLNLLDRSEHSDDDDYPKLETWLQGVKSEWHAIWNSRRRQVGMSQSTPRIMIMLHQVREELDRLWKTYSKTPKRQRDALVQPPTDAELDDAMTWILIQFQVECIVCSHESDVLDQIQKMTRALSERPYQLQVTELECVKKLKVDSGTIPSNNNNNNNNNNDSSNGGGGSDLARAKDTWIRQLQQIPHVSDKKATNLAQHYPTAYSLWHAYQMNNNNNNNSSNGDAMTIEQKRVMCAGLFGEGRQQTKLSDTLYRIMTGTNPQEMI